MIDVKTKIHSFFIFNSSFGPKEGEVVRIPYTTKALSAIGESRGDVIEPSVMYDLLISAYRLFRMFVGPFQDISPDEIYTTCDKFFGPYIASKNLTNDISDVIQGISYLPLDKNSFFKVLCFIDLVEVTYPDFKCVSFVYNEQLIW
ncbi:hypothetical protein MSG28_010299 [Choristoneura fumiferana]|uniref:Uncharacterized protein n=1 Tax=Choristoneura fumiferana TaxID=7141 RepID=A0ACC0KKP7_CHOFU|nr:hypothetical protein MSG28_010299 [Choristoneura fumiferana]